MMEVRLCLCQSPGVNPCEVPACSSSENNRKCVSALCLNDLTCGTSSSDCDTWLMQAIKLLSTQSYLSTRHISGLTVPDT